MNEYERRAAERERIYGDATGPGDGRTSFAAALFAISIFLLVFALSARQATAPGPARNVLESGIAVVTEIDAVLAEDGTALRELARASNEQTFVIPGYPLDVALTRGEVLNLGNDELRQLILDRSSALVYTEGLDAFDRTGDQALGTFSSQRLLDIGVSRISRSTNDRASFFTFIFAAAAALSALFVVLSASGWGKVRTLGFAAAAGALPGVLLFGFAWFMAARIGGTDPFVEDLQHLVRAVLTVPLRNYLVVAIAGLLVGLSGPLLALGERRLEPRDTFYEDDEPFEGAWDSNR